LQVAKEGYNIKILTSDGVSRIKSIVQKNSLLEKSYSLLPICICFLKIAYKGKGMRAVANEMKVIDLHVPKLTADWFSREEYEKFREDLQVNIIHIDAQFASKSKKVKRGATLLRSLHGLQSNERIPVNVNQLGQPLGEGGQLLKQFLGTVARMGDKLPIDCISWRVVPSSNKDDVWDYIQEFKKRSETNKKNKSKHTFFHCAGSKCFADIYHEEDKIRDIKLTQQSTTSSSIATVGDAYEQSSASVCHTQKKKDSLAGRRVRILNFSREVVASGILMSDDNDNVVMGKKLGGEYYEVELEDD
ncbi:hypothetical protein Taro_002659, partial [Colocasia esculenta]|nr:hypothetical protein [Colocasia esculenta]